ncbi:hypothetical protein Q9966_009320 [Columba livia]|nr:hypothetical protein Q9966_009320 [Columba livia]
MKALKATTLVLLLGLFSFGVYHVGQLGAKRLWSTTGEFEVLRETLSLPIQLRKLQEQLYHLRWSTKDVAEQALQEGLKQAKLPGVTGRAVHEIINQALEKLEEMQVPMPDYALKSAGAAVIRSRTSPSLQTAKAKVFLYSLPVMDYMRSPELILEGFKEEHEEQGPFLGQFTFLAELNPSQTFQLKLRSEVTTCNDQQMPSSSVEHFGLITCTESRGHQNYDNVSDCESAENITALGHGIGRVDRASQLDPGYEPWAVPESMVIKPLGVILFLSLGAIPGVSDQVKKAETNRPVCSPVTGQESGCDMDLPITSSTKVAAPKDSKLAKLKSSLLASAALELNITMSPPSAMKLVLSAKNATSCGRRAEVIIAHHLIHNLPTTPTPWTPPTPTPWPVGKLRVKTNGSEGDKYHAYIEFCDLNGIDNFCDFATLLETSCSNTVALMFS